MERHPLAYARAGASARTPAHARRRAVSPTGGVGGTIRWDRVARITLLVVLGAILLLYIAPLSHWVTQTGTAAEQRAEVRGLERENERLRARVAHLSRPSDVEREARELGMVRRGERPFVIQGAPAR